MHPSFALLVRNHQGWLAHMEIWMGLQSGFLANFLIVLLRSVLLNHSNNVEVSRYHAVGVIYWLIYGPEHLQIISHAKRQLNTLI